MNLNRKFRAHIGVAALAIASIFAVGATEASAETVFATTVSNTLVSFDSSTPCVILTSNRITGLQDGEQILAIDFRPATGVLYGLGSTSRIYTIDTLTGVATAVGSGPFTPALEGSAFGFDFNPVVDRIRIVSDSGQNLRVNPTTGAVQIVDGVLSFAASDVNAGNDPFVVGAAYTNPDNNQLTGTTLYDIDSALDILAIQNPPNSGTLNTVGGLGVSTNDLAGFDISSSNTAFAALKTTGKRTEQRPCGNSELVTIDLASGAAISAGYIGTRQPILGLAVVLASSSQ